jgi:hypothetical protein
MEQELGHMSYIKGVKNDIILLNMHNNYMFVPFPKTLLPKT